VRQATNNGTTPLVIAARNGHRDIVALLFNQPVHAAAKEASAVKATGGPTAQDGLSAFLRAEFDRAGEIWRPLLARQCAGVP